MTRPHKRPGWTASGDGRDKLRRRFTHDSGIAVVHCGHPTAHNPWYVVDPDGNRIGASDRVTRKGRPVGVCFQHVGSAMDWVEARLWPTVSIPMDSTDPADVRRGWAFRWEGQCGQ